MKQILFYCYYSVFISKAIAMLKNSMLLQQMETELLYMRIKRGNTQIKAKQNLKHK